MKKLIAIVVFLVNAVGMSAQTYCDFMGIPLGINKDAFDKQMKEKGFEPCDFYIGDSHFYSGMYCGKDVQVMVKSNPIEGFVYLVNVMFYNEDENSRSAIFDSLARKLKQEYKDWKVEIEDDGSYWFSYWSDKGFPMAVMIVSKENDEFDELLGYRVALHITDYIKYYLHKKMMGD